MLNYKKPAFWLAAVAVVAVAVAALVFLTNPATENVQTLADITQSSALFDNVETLKLVEEKGETTAPAAQTQTILSDLQATEISVDPVSENRAQTKAAKLILGYGDGNEKAVYFNDAFSEVWLEDGIAYKVMDPDSAKRILETVRTSAVAESPTATETLPVPVSLPEYKPGSVKLEPQDQDEFSFERKYRLAYYRIWGYFTACLTEEETADYMQWVDEYNKSTNYGETQEEMLLVTYIKRYNISRAEFDAAVEKMQAEMPPEDGVIYEESEIPNGDIIYTFDNEVINRYYRYA